jgi:hypothetical protein
MSVILFVIRILVILLIIRFVLRFIASMRAGYHSAPRPSRRVPERAGGTLVRDPNCGTYLPESRAIAVGSGASALHFCSTTCRDAYAAAHRNGASGSALRTS